MFDQTKLFYLNFCSNFNFYFEIFEELNFDQKKLILDQKLQN